MFKKGQLVRSRDTSRLYEFIRNHRTHFLSGAQAYRDVALVREVVDGHCGCLTLPFHILELVGNNYRPKALK